MLPNALALATVLLLPSGRVGVHLVPCRLLLPLGFFDIRDLPRRKILSRWQLSVLLLCSGALLCGWCVELYELCQRSLQQRHRKLGLHFLSRREIPPHDGSELVCGLPSGSFLCSELHRALPAPFCHPAVAEVCYKRSTFDVVLPPFFCSMRNSVLFRAATVPPGPRLTTRALWASTRPPRPARALPVPRDATRRARLSPVVGPVLAGSTRAAPASRLAAVAQRCVLLLSKMCSHKMFAPGTGLLVKIELTSEIHRDCSFGRLCLRSTGLLVPLGGHDLHRVHLGQILGCRGLGLLLLRPWPLLDRLFLLLLGVPIR